MRLAVGMLVDTNVISEVMKPRPNARVAAWFSELERFSLSVVSLEEIRFGLALRRSARVERAFEELLEHYVAVLPVTSEIAERSGLLRAEHRARGRTRTQADMLIAATAYVHRLHIVTRNVRDFEGCGVTVLDPFVETPARR